MAARLSLEDKLAALRAIRDAEPSESHKSELKRYLGDRSNLVVATAATLAAEGAFLELAGDMEAAFDRFLVDPVKNDKLCRAKIAIVQALDKLEHLKRDVFEKAARCIQLEPAFGAPVDTAVPLRGAAIFALARIGGSDYHCLLVDALTDTEKDVRIAAAQALAYVGTEAAGLVLRLKARLGDADPDVFSDCLSGLLTIGPEANLDFVCEFLRPTDPPRCEAAALALGKTKLPAALEALKSCSQRSYEKTLRNQILLAISMMRLPAAIDFLLELVASDSESSALAAMTVLKFHRYDARLCERLAQTVKRTGSRALQIQLDRDFAAAP